MFFLRSSLALDETERLEFVTMMMMENLGPAGLGLQANTGVPCTSTIIHLLMNFPFLIFEIANTFQGKAIYLGISVIIICVCGWFIFIEEFEYFLVL